jgi:hypothetical protein
MIERFRKSPRLFSLWNFLGFDIGEVIDSRDSVCVDLLKRQILPRWVFILILTFFHDDPAIIELGVVAEVVPAFFDVHSSEEAIIIEHVFEVLLGIAVQHFEQLLESYGAVFTGIEPEQYFNLTIKASFRQLFYIISCHTYAPSKILEGQYPPPLSIEPLEHAIAP